MALRSKVAQLHGAHTKPYKSNKIIETILNKQNQSIYKPFIPIEIKKHNYKFGDRNAR